MLVRAGPEGIAAGAIAEQLALRRNTLSAHLAVLSHAGLVVSRRQGRSIIYAARLDRLDHLLASLTQDCCGGRPDLCAPTRVRRTFSSSFQKDPAMPTKTFNVLFLCTGNTARSILAESILRKDGAGRFAAFSAGSQPKGVVNPFAVRVLEASGYPTQGLRSKSWEEFAGTGAPVMDFIFTVCDSAAGEACPVWPGHPATAHWGIEDPAAATGTDIDRERAFVTAFRLLKHRIDAFVALPHDRLAGQGLADRLADIGTMSGATPGPAKCT
jgi:ArsR family transcriptional regulator, arsenate/arsenite/antimonite-responsive transcriptional repressor / arsenate reductase (thioredoxin)